MYHKNLPRLKVFEKGAGKTFCLKSFSRETLFYRPGAPNAIARDAARIRTEMPSAARQKVIFRRSPEFRKRTVPPMRNGSANAAKMARYCKTNSIADYSSQLPTVRGNGMTSRMLETPVRYMTQRSKPRPKPA